MRGEAGGGETGRAARGRRCGRVGERAAEKRRGLCGACGRICRVGWVSG